MVSEEQQHSSDENNAFRGGSNSSQIRQVRLVQPDRRQLSWTMLDVERLVDEDHPVRAIWELAGRLDLSRFSAAIGSLEGAAGRPAYDPRLLISLWIYAYSRGIGSAREVERRCEHDPAFRWLTGLLVINHHTLSDFRLEHRAALDSLFTQVLGVLERRGFGSLKTVMHDGTKIAAHAGRGSFRRGSRSRSILKRREIVSRQWVILDAIWKRREKRLHEIALGARANRTARARGC